MITNIIAGGLLIIGFLFAVISTLGVLKFNDFYKRLHASGMGESFGFVLMCLGVIVYQGFSLISVKILFVILALFIINTIGTHLIAKAEFESKRKEEQDADSNH